MNIHNSALHRNADRPKSQVEHLLDTNSNFLDEVTQTVVMGLDTLLSDMLDRADDILFKWADRSRDQSRQQLYFAAMRDLRVQRNNIERRFSDSVKHAISMFFSGEYKFEKPETWDDIIQYELLDDDTVEEQLAINNMSVRVERKSGELLYFIAKRFNTITPYQNLENKVYPLHPTSFARNFSEAISEMSNSLDVKLVTYKLFQESVMDQLETIYKEVNKLLIEANILPHMRNPVIDVKETSHEKKDHLASQNRELPSTVNTSAIECELDHDHQSMLRIITGDSCFDKLSEMQSKILVEDPSEYTQPQKLYFSLSKFLHTSPNSGKSNRHLRAKMLSEIFELIYDEQDILPETKLLILKLQIPYFKIAISDASFFSNHNHVARKLLNSLVQAAIIWDFNNSKTTSQCYIAIEIAVHRVLNEFKADLKSIAGVLSEFEEFCAATNHKQEQYEERARKTFAGKERLQLAKYRIEEKISNWCSQNRAPLFIDEFIEQHWKQLLLTTYMKNGDTSPEWTQYTNTIDRLIQCVRLDFPTGLGSRFSTLVHNLLKDLQTGMEVASLHPATCELFFYRLRQYCSTVFADKFEKKEILREFGKYLSNESTSSSVHDNDEISTIHCPTMEKQPQSSDNGEIRRPTPQHDNTVDSGSKTASHSSTEYVSSLEETKHQNPESLPPHEIKDLTDPKPDSLQSNYTFACGDWFELMLNGKNVRVKLSWISPVTGSCLFVDQKGTKVLSDTCKWFTEELKTKRARPLLEERVVDQALRLLSQTGSSIVSSEVY